MQRRWEVSMKKKYKRKIEKEGMQRKKNKRNKNENFLTTNETSTKNVD